jgi:uncharacterized alpha-E superfamily protein
MISRVAESCFWLNRYVERVEVLARMLDVNLTFQLDVSIPDAERWRPLVVVSGQEDPFLEAHGAGAAEDAEVVQEYLTWSEANPSSLFSSLRAARENARTIRETISLEMWETLNDLWVFMRQREARRLYQRDRHVFYRRLRDQCLLYHGVTQATILHEEPLHFMRLGTALERAAQTARVLDVKHHSIGPTLPSEAEETVGEAAHWLATLRFCSGVEPFLKRQDNVLCGRTVAAFLLFDPSFPRSVRHNLDRMANFLTLLCAPPNDGIGTRSRKLVTAVRERLDQRDIDRVLAEGLHETATYLVEVTGEIGICVDEEFFQYATAVRDRARSQSQSQGPDGATQRQEA